MAAPSSDDLVLELSVQPGARRNGWNGRLGNRFKIQLTAPAVDGKANKALIGFLAKHFAVRKSEVILLQGKLTRHKRVRILSPKETPELRAARTRT